MNKSFAISQSMREEVAMKLTVKATEKAATKLKARLEKLNADFWAAHQRRLESMTSLPMKKMRELIQEGVIITTGTVTPLVRKEIDGGVVWAKPLSYFCYRPELDLNVRILKAVGLMSANATGLVRPERFSTVIAFHFTSETTMPDVKDRERVTDGNIARRLNLAAAEADRVINAAKEFYRDSLRILMGCKTSRQVEDVFPEAAKLLPQPVKKATGSMIPQDQVDQVRRMLKNGVPAGKE